MRLTKKLMVISLCIVLLIPKTNDSTVMNKYNFHLARLQMVETQIKTRGIKNKAVLNAMQIVPRHLFVPANMQDYAYLDGPLDIGYGQTISQPYIVAFMTEVMQLNAESKVLEIGTGSGYQAAVLSKICQTVYSIEIIEELAEITKTLLHKLGYDNIYLKIGDGNIGWPSAAPFDVIIITAAAKYIPRSLLNQLKVGGRMVMPLAEDDFNQTLILLIKTDEANNFRQEKLMPVRFVPLTGNAT
ncbi:protein-L-isoaspartate(D-aspartate) O-methyltransferase [Candidatus Tisiphia endosymbiont of Nemotelus uliginosus]|uniref:protein-L-isoaspartate(D-aspartate) O-methyltransferase n=1 Tax=Candidatus Tisiphia endosymbiont of Nemotelus uliginosus TaxID=3077926 RepID=UPI0035C93DDF